MNCSSDFIEFSKSSSLFSYLRFFENCFSTSITLVYLLNAFDAIVRCSHTNYPSIVFEGNESKKV